MSDQPKQSTVEILRKARAKIEKPENWCKGVLKEYIDRYGPACKWCAFGAIVECCENREQYGIAGGWLKRAIGDMGHNSIPRFNDATDRTHAEVLAAFDKAITLATQEQEREHG